MATAISLGILATGVEWEQRGDGSVTLPSGREVMVYLRGTTTPVSVFSDAGLSVPLAQPLVTGGGGVPGAIPGFIAAEQSIDFFDVAASARTQAEPLNVADLIGSDGKIGGAGSVGLAAAVVNASSARIYASAPTGVAATDTAEIAARLAALPATGGSVVLQPGAYAVNAPIVVPAGGELVGAGVPARFSQDPTNSPTRILYSGATAAILFQPGAGSIIRKGSVGRLHIDGASAAASTDGLLLDSSAAGSGVTGLTFCDLTLSNFPGYQIHEKDGGVGAVWGTDFDRVTVHNAASGANDLIRWEGNTNNTTSNTWRACVLNPYAAGTWAFNGGGGHTFVGGVVQPSNGGAGANGLLVVNGFLQVFGTWFEGALSSQTATIGIRWSGSGGAFIAPQFCGTFGIGVEVGDGTSAFALGAQLAGNIGGFNAGAGCCDIHITDGGTRAGTIILTPGLASSTGPTIIDDRATGSGVHDVLKLCGRQLVVPQGAGFWGHTPPSSQPAAPVTTADLIAIVRGCGLSA